MEENNNKMIVSVQMKVLAGCIATVLAAIILSITVCNVGVVPVCFVVLIEVLLSVCLDGLPVAVHGMVMAAQIIVGAVCGNTLFIILNACVYLVAVLAIGFRKEK